MTAPVTSPVTSPGTSPGTSHGTSHAAAHLLDEAVARIGASPSLASVERLARWLARCVVRLSRPTCFELLGDLAAASEQSRRTGEGVVLAEAATGHVMVVRHFPAGKPTPIHGHGGWGAVVVLRGRGRYETWEPTTDGFARLVEARELGPGDSLAWADPPNDIHRQEGLEGGTTELTIFARHPYHTHAPQFQPVPPPLRADLGILPGIRPGRIPRSPGTGQGTAGR